MPDLKLPSNEQNYKMGFQPYGASRNSNTADTLNLDSRFEVEIQNSKNKTCETDLHRCSISEHLNNKKFENENISHKDLQFIPENISSFGSYDLINLKPSKSNSNVEKCNKNK